ncbi:orotate phosphoribosyltransferase, partial [Thermus scotoductus]
VLVGVGAIVDRSGGKAAFGVPFRALLKLEVPQYLPEACPLCRDGVPLEEV